MPAIESEILYLEDCDVGLTGLEPVTLRLSSACSNQLSYTPRLRAVRFGAASPLAYKLLAQSLSRLTGWPEP